MYNWIQPIDVYLHKLETCLGKQEPMCVFGWLDYASRRCAPAVAFHCEGRVYWQSRQEQGEAKEIDLNR